MIAIAIFLITLGVIKVTFSILSLVLSPEYKNKLMKKQPGIRFVINQDNSTNGKLICVMILVLGIYTLIHGMIYFKLFPTALKFLFSNYISQVIFYIVLGVFSIVYFSIAINNSTSDKNNEEYRIFGTGTGYLLIAASIISVLLHHILDRKESYQTNTNLALAFLALIWIAFFIIQLYISFKKQNASINLISSCILILANLIPF